MPREGAFVFRFHPGASRSFAMAVAATLVMGLAPLAAPAPASAVVLAAPTLTSPSDGASISGNPVFAWTAVSSAAKYRLEVSADPGFSPLVSGFPVTTLNLRYAPPAELPIATLYWRVAALDAGNVVGTYAYGKFDKSIGAAPNVISPANHAQLTFPTDPLFFQWEALAGASSYELQVDDATDFVGATSYTTKNTSYVITEPRTVGQTFYWRVRGDLGALNSDWSDTFEFSSVWPTKPALVYPPADAIDITDVYFDWDPVPGARTYQLQVSPNADWANNRTIDVTVKSTRYDPPTPLNNGNYYWRVRAIDAASNENFGPWSDTEGVAGDERVFQRNWRTNSGTPYLSDIPHLLWPPDGGSTADQDTGDGTWQNPTFSWTPARHASWYRVPIQHHGGPDHGLPVRVDPGMHDEPRDMDALCVGDGYERVGAGLVLRVPRERPAYFWDVAGWIIPSRTRLHPIRGVHPHRPAASSASAPRFSRSSTHRRPSVTGGRGPPDSRRLPDACQVRHG